jgi:hypothetical protein
MVVVQFDAVKSRSFAKAQDDIYNQRSLRCYSEEHSDEESQTEPLPRAVRLLTECFYLRYASNTLMSLSGMVEIPRLQAKREFVMPAKAGIQVDF